MLLLTRFVLAACLLVCASALQVSWAQTLPDLQLSDAQWRARVTYIGERKNNADKSGRSQDDYPFYSTGERDLPRDRGVGTVYIASVQARNTGVKTITAVTWQYTFYKDAQKTQVLRGQTFFHNTKIKPGKTETLKSSVYPLDLPTSKYGAVRVLRLEYSDGTAWESP